MEGLLALRTVSQQKQGGRLIGAQAKAIVPATGTRQDPHQVLMSRVVRTGAPARRQKWRSVLLLCQIGSKRDVANQGACCCELFYVLPHPQHFVVLPLPKADERISRRSKD